MAASATRDAVYVEGPDDEHAIGQLLIRRGGTRSVSKTRRIEGQEGVLDAIKVSICRGTGPGARAFEWTRNRRSR